MKNPRWYLPLRLALTDSAKGTLELCLLVWRARHKTALVFEVVLGAGLLLASGVGYNGYISYELCHQLPVVDGQTVGIEFAHHNARLAAEFMRGIVNS